MLRKVLFFAKVLLYDNSNELVNSGTKLGLPRVMFKESVLSV